MHREMINKYSYESFLLNAYPKIIIHGNLYINNAYILWLSLGYLKRLLLLLFCKDFL